MFMEGFGLKSFGSKGLGVYNSVMKFYQFSSWDYMLIFCFSYFHRFWFVVSQLLMVTVRAVYDCWLIICFCGAQTICYPIRSNGGLIFWHGPFRSLGPLLLWSNGLVFQLRREQSREGVSSEVSHRYIMILVRRGLMFEKN